MLYFSAKYTLPTIELIQKKPQNEERTLECKSIGYPEGQLCWFDMDGHNWTESAAMKSRQLEDGRVELSSRLTTRYNLTCAVFNASGTEEHRVVLPRSEGILGKWCKTFFLAYSSVEPNFIVFTKMYQVTISIDRNPRIEWSNFLFAEQIRSLRHRVDPVEATCLQP